MQLTASLVIGVTNHLRSIYNSVIKETPVLSVTSISFIYMFKRIGDKTSPCSSQVLTVNSLDISPALLTEVLKSTYSGLRTYTYKQFKIYQLQITFNYIQICNLLRSITTIYYPYPIPASKIPQTKANTCYFECCIICMTYLVPCNHQVFPPFR